MTKEERKEFLLEYLKDKDFTFTIYHIPGVKVGCDHDIEREDNRPKQKGFTEWEVLHQTKDIFEASELEIKELRERGYKVDGTYWNTYVSGILTTKKRWKEDKQKMINTFVKAGSDAAKIWAKNNEVEFKLSRSKGGIASGKSLNHTSKQRRICPHCGKVTVPCNAKRWHFDNCKSNP